MTDNNRHFKLLTLSLLTVSCDISLVPPVQAAGFIDDSQLTGNIYYWQRDRERKDLSDGKYKTNLSHGTWNSSLDFSSGYAAGMIGIDLAAFTAIEMTEAGESGHPNEIAFSSSNRAYSEDWRGDKSGLSLYKAAAKIKYGPYKLRMGYIQPEGQTLLAPHWSLLPGTYQGAEAEADYDYAAAGNLKFSYMWANRYKSPWHLEMDGFYKNDRNSRISWLHSLGAKYSLKNGLILEAAYGEAKNYTRQFLAKASYSFDLAGSPLNSSYQFYGSRNYSGQQAENQLYDGTAWLQALTLGYRLGQVDLRLEATAVKAEGRQGYFLQRMTPTYSSSNGRLDIWWDNRSDFNANGEKAIFLSTMYDLSNWQLPGWAVGASVAYGWSAKPSSVNDSPDRWYRQGSKISESSWSLDGLYTVQEGRAKGTLFKLHFTHYNNHSNIPDGAGGYGNLFQDERDVKFIMMVPFSLI
ncbi:OprD family outer membrane porin [Tatumella sp. UBA2305]|uniref:OprD family outer membrane porin n=1 Tax=Tatumella sp. UBA2305 TaxID=1947647 RepID=UPI0025DCF82D|nr:OprD family outer membrane porin [Tatumella sp. UBA2305]